MHNASKLFYSQTTIVKPNQKFLIPSKLHTYSEHDVDCKLICGVWNIAHAQVLCHLLSPQKKLQSNRSGRMVKSVVLRHAWLWVWAPPMFVDISASTWIKKGSTAMLTTRHLAGVAPEVNLRNIIAHNWESSKQGIHPGFET